MPATTELPVTRTEWLARLDDIERSEIRGAANWLLHHRGEMTRPVRHQIAAAVEGYTGLSTPAVELRGRLATLGALGPDYAALLERAINPLDAEPEVAAAPTPDRRTRVERVNAMLDAALCDDLQDYFGDQELVAPPSRTRRRRTQVTEENAAPPRRTRSRTVAEVAPEILQQEASRRLPSPFVASLTINVNPEEVRRYATAMDSAREALLRETAGMVTQAPARSLNPRSQALVESQARELAQRSMAAHIRPIRTTTDTATDYVTTVRVVEGLSHGVTVEHAPLETIGEQAAARIELELDATEAAPAPGAPADPRRAAITAIRNEDAAENFFRRWTTATSQQRVRGLGPLHDSGHRDIVCVATETALGRQGREFELWYFQPGQVPQAPVFIGGVRKANSSHWVGRLNADDTDLMNVRRSLLIGAMTRRRRALGMRGHPAGHTL